MPLMNRLTISGRTFSLVKVSSPVRLGTNYLYVITIVINRLNEEFINSLKIKISTIKLLVI